MPKYTYNVPSTYFDAARFENEKNSIRSSKRSLKIAVDALLEHGLETYELRSIKSKQDFYELIRTKADAEKQERTVVFKGTYREQELGIRNMATGSDWQSFYEKNIQYVEVILRFVNSTNCIVDEDMLEVDEAKSIEAARTRCTYDIDGKRLKSIIDSFLRVKDSFEIFEKEVPDIITIFKTGLAYHYQDSDARYRMFSIEDIRGKSKDGLVSICIEAFAPLCKVNE